MAQAEFFGGPLDGQRQAVSDDLDTYKVPRRNTDPNLWRISLHGTGASLPTGTYRAQGWHGTYRLFVWQGWGV